MTSYKERRELISKVIIITLTAIILLSIIRVLLIHDNLLKNDFIHVLIFKEICFSILSAGFIFLILYIMINEEIRKINTKALNYAFRDALTGLYNRHYLNDFLKNFTTLNKKDSIFAVAFIDIDKFKEINDTYGHNTGDCILKSLALKLRSLISSEDILCRYGGEEFVIIYSDIYKDDIVKKMNNIKESVQNMQFNCKHKSITISIGLSFGKNGDNIDKIMQESDKALYMAKRAGRNCVKIFVV